MSISANDELTHQESCITFKDGTIYESNEACISLTTILYSDMLNSHFAILISIVPWKE